LFIPFCPLPFCPVSPRIDGYTWLHPLSGGYLIFGYLISVITTDAKCRRNNKGRIAIGKAAFSKRRELLRGRNSTGT